MEYALPCLHRWVQVAGRAALGRRGGGTAEKGKQASRLVTQGVVWVFAAPQCRLEGKPKPAASLSLAPATPLPGCWPLAGVQTCVFAAARFRLCLLTALAASSVLTNPKPSPCSAMARPGTPGDELMLRAVSDHFGLPINIATSDAFMWCVQG